MTVSVEQRPAGATGRPRRTALLALAVGVPILLALIAAAGFTHPWNAGSGLAAGEYTRDYSLTRQYEDTTAERCVTVTLTGTMSAHYSSPAWSLGGPGWTSPTLSATDVDTTLTSNCAEDELLADDVEAAQFWATETCAEPFRSASWPESAELGRCDQDLVAGSSTSGPDPLTWRGTVYGDSVCLDGMATAEGVTIGGYRVCLDPETANQV